MKYCRIFFSLLITFLTIYSFAAEINNKINHHSPKTSEKFQDLKTNWQPLGTRSLTEPVRFPYQRSDISNTNSCPIVLSNGDLLLVWGTPDSLAFARSRDGGDTWKPDSLIASTPGYVPDNLSGICTQTGRAIIIWRDTQVLELMMSFSDYNGVSWSSPAAITASGRNERWTSLSQTLDGTLWLFYADDVPGNARDIFYLTSSDNGATWSAEQTFLSTPDPASEINASVISVNDSTLQAFYQDNSSGYSHIYQMSSIDSGQTWSSPVIIGQVYQDEFHAHVLRQSDGTLWMIYGANTLTPVLGTLQNDIYYITSNDRGTTWSSPTQFTQYVGNDDGHNVALLNDQPFLSFNSWRWANYNQYQIWYGIIGTMNDTNLPPALFNREIISPLPGQLITVRAHVDDESEISNVNIAYSVDGIPASSFPMYDDGTHNDHNALDNIWGTTIGPFQIGDTIAYSFSISDNSANTIEVDAGTFDMPPVHTAGNVILSIFENSKLADENNVSGRSAYWEASGGNDCLYLGGLWVGAEFSGEQRVMNMHYNEREWTHMSGTPITSEPGISDQDISIHYDDQFAQSAPIGLEVHQQSYQWSGSTRDDFIVFRYTIKNTGLNGDLDNVYVAAWLDPDITTGVTGGAADDMGSYDYQRGLAYLYDPAQNPSGYLGIKLFGAIPNTANFYPNPGDPNDDQQRFQFMTAGIQTNATYPSDWRILLTAPPFDLAAGDSYTVGFGLVMGTETELLANTDTMITLYEQVWGVSQPLPSPPGNLIAIDKLDNEVALYWDDPGGSLGFNIYRTDSPSPIGNVPPDHPRFIDTNVNNGQVYSYYITALWNIGEGAPSDTTTGYPMAIPDEPGKVVSYARPGGRPYGIAFDGTNVWMSSWYSAEIVKFDPVTWQALGSIPAPGGQGYGMDWDGTSLWVANRPDGGVYQIDLDGNILQFLDVPPGDNGDELLTGLAYENGNIWVMDRNNFVVHKFDAASGTLSETISMPPEFQLPASPQGLGYLPDRGTFMVGVLTDSSSKTTVYEVSATDFNLTGRNFEFNMEYDPGSSEFYSSIRGGLTFNPLTGNYWIGDVWTDMIYEVLPFPMVDFSSNLNISDNNGKSQNLVFGTANYATDGFDSDYDIWAPPLPPAGAFDARFSVGGVDFFNDYRATLIDTIVWDIYYQASDGGEPVTLNWNISEFPEEGFFTLMGPSGSLVYLDMRTANSFTDNLNLGHLKIVYSLTTVFTSAVAQGWNMVSLPHNVSDPNYHSVYPNALPNTLYGFNGSYYSADSLNICTGYWLRFPAAENIPIEGIPINSYSMELALGWNMIGGISCDLRSSDIDDPGNIIITGTLYGFNGAYYLSDSIKQGYGYWIRTSDSGQVSLISGAGASQSLAKRFDKQPDLEQFSSLQINDATGASQTLYFNIQLENPEANLSYSLPPLPPAGSFDARFEGDYRICEGEKAIIQIQSSNYPLTISASNITLEEGFQYLIREIIAGEEGETYVLQQGNSIEITNPEVTTLKLTKEEVVPLTFMVKQNYPNPFNPETVIEYSIPQNERVEISIYNTLGQKIKTLVSENKKAGFYEIVWDASNDAGLKVGSGIFFYSVKAGKNRSVKKMVLLK